MKEQKRKLVGPAKSKTQVFEDAWLTLEWDGHGRHLWSLRIGHAEQSVALNDLMPDAMFAGKLGTNYGPEGRVTVTVHFEPYIEEEEDG